MCGISGVLADRPGSELLFIARQMNDSLSHRGPDMSGEWTDPSAGIALAHRRLSILDLSPDGRQPMESRTGRYVITFNGEIYNHRSLRAELMASGHRFRGGSDTEVLLAILEQRGLPNALRVCDGMFAFALWDRVQRTLHLVRDRLGKKPLYYGWRGPYFVFASELKAFMAVPMLDASIDRGALTSYLRHQYVPGPCSILQGIRKLPAGTHVGVTLEGTGQPTSYWSMHDVAEQQNGPVGPTDEARLIDDLDRIFQRAVADRMIADVPVGAFLSGGIDSSLVSAVMQRGTETPIDTFTIGFDEPEFDESPQAAAVAQAIGSRHHMVRMSADSFLETVPTLPQIYDEPFADPSAIPMLHIARYARERVTVCLSGDGGDEMFGGYGRYQIASRLGQGIERYPAWLRHACAGAIDRVSPQMWDRLFHCLPSGAGDNLRGGMSGDRMLKLAALVRSGNAGSLYRSMTSVHDRPETLVLGGIEATDPIESGISDPLRQMMLIDTLRYLPDDILVKVDRATMAVGLEARAPLLDRELVEYSWRLPRELLVRNGRGKWPLHSLFRRYLPAELADRPKRGFSVPIESWLRGPLRGWAEDLLDPDALAADGFLAGAPVRKLWREHLEGHRNWSFQLWSILMFQSWKRHWQSSLDAASARKVAA